MKCIIFLLVLLSLLVIVSYAVGKFIYLLEFPQNLIYSTPFGSFDSGSPFSQIITFRITSANVERVTSKFIESTQIYFYSAKAKLENLSCTVIFSYSTAIANKRCRPLALKACTRYMFTMSTRYQPFFFILTYDSVGIGCQVQFHI